MRRDGFVGEDLVGDFVGGGLVGSVVGGREGYFLRGRFVRLFCRYIIGCFRDGKARFSK